MFWSGHAHQDPDMDTPHHSSDPQTSQHPGQRKWRTEERREDLGMWLFYEIYVFNFLPRFPTCGNACITVLSRDLIPLAIFKSLRTLAILSTRITRITVGLMMKDCPSISSRPIPIKDNTAMARSSWFHLFGKSFRLKWWTKLNTLLVRKVSWNTNSKHFKDDFTEKYSSETVIAYVQGQVQILKMRRFYKTSWQLCEQNLRHHVKFHCHCDNIDANDCWYCQVKILWCNKIVCL